MAAIDANTLAEALVATAPLPPCARAAVATGALHVGLLGCGVVGGALARALIADAGPPDGAPRLHLSAVAVRDQGRPRDVDLIGRRITSDPFAVALDPSIDVVVEAIGGIEPARSLVHAALQEGKSVVTANKQLLAHHGDELLAAARARGVSLKFNAAVGGAVPVLELAGGRLATGRIRKVTGVLNATTNYVLERMASDGLALDDALAEAYEHGFAERDSRLDLDGSDAAAKAVIVAGAAFGTRLDGIPIRPRGISEITPSCLSTAAAAGYEVKLVASIQPHGDHVDVDVGPRALPRSHPLSVLKGRDNGVVCSTSGGDLFLSGPGAGGDATAAALLADLVAIARSYERGHSSPSRIRREPVPIRCCSASSEQAHLVVVPVRGEQDADRLRWLGSSRPNDVDRVVPVRILGTAAVITRRIGATDRVALLGRLAAEGLVARACLPCAEEAS